MKSPLIAVALCVGLGLAGCRSGRDDAAAQPSDAAAPIAQQPTRSSGVAPAAASRGPARRDGYAGLRFGMDEAQVRRAWPGKLEGHAEAGSDCLLLRPQGAQRPFPLSFMFDHGKLVRYDVGNRKDSAPGGGQVGMPAEQIRQLYAGQATAQPDKYDPAAQQLRVADTASQNVLLFEIGADGKVSRWRVGLPPQVDYAEGCG